jgi:hypothetical protein
VGIGGKDASVVEENMVKNDGKGKDLTLADGASERVGFGFSNIVPTFTDY